MIAIEHYNEGVDYGLLGELETFQENGIKCQEKIEKFKDSHRENVDFLNDILFHAAPGQETKAKFQTDISCREDLEKWILNVKKIKKPGETNESSTYEKFRDLDTSGNNEFQITKKPLMKILV